MTKHFTGWHMTAILIAFFGVVIAVNVLLAVEARRTFGGAISENGYVASQNYNRWIRESEAQDRLGWTAQATMQGDRLLVEIGGVDQATVSVIARHPLGLAPERSIAMRALGAREFISSEAMPVGRWKLHIDIAKGEDRARFLADVQR